MAFRWKFLEYAPRDTRYEQGAFDASLGKEIPVKKNDILIGTATLISVTITHDGAIVEFEMESDDEALHKAFLY